MPIFCVIFLTPWNISGQEWPTNGWSNASPSEVGMDANQLIQARDYATSLGGGSGFIARYGKLVFSWGSLSERYQVKSATKTVGMIALGLAIKDSLLRLDDFADQHHPNFGVPPQSNITTGWLDDITVLHLATHTAGFENNGGYTELLFEPGTAWKYSSGGANWLAEIITLAYSEDLDTVMFNRVFSPMGITSNDLRWRSNNYRSDLINGIKNREFGSGISANVDAMARIGYLLLRKGQWEGQEIIPNSYVETAVSPVSEFSGLTSLSLKFPNGPKHYGLLVWNNADGVMSSIPQDVFMAWGINESFIIVIPSLDIVVSRAGNRWTQDPTTESFYPYLEIFLGYIINSVNGINPGDLIITEFMANPASVSNNNGEYIEFFNTTNNPIDMNGLVLEDDGSDSTLIYIGSPLIIQPHGFLVIGNNQDSLTNGGYQCSYEYSGFSLSNSADEIVLETQAGTEVCRLNYLNGDPFGAGVSAELSDIALNVNGITHQADYVAATTTYGLGDYGSPGIPDNTQNTGCLPGLFGDVNNDNAVNSVDALIILSKDAGIAVPLQFEERINLGFGDVNQNGFTNSTDGLIILSFDVQLPTPFPIGDPACL